MWFSWYDLEEEYSEAAPTSVPGEQYIQYIQKHGENVFITLREIWTEVSQPQGVSMS